MPCYCEFEGVTSGAKYLCKKLLSCQALIEVNARLTTTATTDIRSKTDHWQAIKREMATEHQTDVCIYRGNLVQQRERPNLAVNIFSLKLEG
jgi:hypothetical protein